MFEHLTTAQRINAAMLNDEHVAMRKGVDAWNEWRRKKVFAPKLIGANWSLVDLSDCGEQGSQN